MINRWILPLLVVLGILFLALYPRLPTYQDPDDKRQAEYVQPYDRVGTTAGSGR